MITRRALSAAVVPALLMVPIACSEDTPDAPGAASEPSSQGSIHSESTAPTSPLEGLWRAEITEEAYAAAMVAGGYPDDVLAQALELLPGPKAEFRLEFLGDRFRMSTVSDDEQYQSGTFAVDSDELTIDDEAPVGTPTLRFAVEGDALTFQAAPEDVDPPMLGFWCSATWTRE